MTNNAVCSFLGHGEIYDSALDAALSACIKRLVRENDEITFLFYRRGAFYDRCLLAALTARQHNPQKKITIACIAGAEWEQPCFPASMIDGVIAPPPEIVAPCGDEPMAIYRATERWMLRQSTHLIAYLYSGLHEPQSRLLSFAQKCGLTICNVTNKETAAFLAQSVQGLPAHERLLVEQIYQGKMLKEIGAPLGLTASGVRRAAGAAFGWLRKALAGRESAAPAPASCGIFELGPAMPEALEAFEETVLFLIGKCRVTRFEIASEYCHSEYMKVLNNIVGEWPYHHVQLVAVTHDPDTPADEWRAMQAILKFVPPCDEVVNIDLHLKRLSTMRLRKAKAIIERTDFCICKVRGMYSAGGIKRYLLQKHNSIAFGVDGRF